MKEKQLKPPVFIVGCGHSGTTIMARILGEHPNMHLINYDIGTESNIFLKKYNPRTFAKWNAITLKAGKQRWIEKTPKHVEVIPKILEQFPEAKILVMVRNGFDVVASIKHRRNKTFQEGMERWIIDNLAWMDLFDQYENIYFQKLEDFVGNPEFELEMIVSWLNEPYNSNMLNYHEQEKRFWNESIFQGKNAKKRNRQINQPLMENTSRWHDDLNRNEKRILFQNHTFMRIMGELYPNAWT